MKVVKNFLITLITMFVFVPNAMAYTIVVNGDTEIENYAYPEKASFNETTNTLTLNNYNGKAIAFDGFDSNSTINIILKGNNVISSDTYDGSTKALGQHKLDGELVNLNIVGEDGAKLLINNYNVGIYVDRGNLSISSLDIKATNVGSHFIYNKSGLLLSINDSIIDVDGVEVPIKTDRAEIEFNNVTYSSRNTSDQEIDADSTLTITNSKFDISDGDYGIFGSNTNIKDSEFIFNNVSNGIGARRKVIIDNSNFRGTEVGNNIIYSDASYVEITNSEIELSNSGSGISAATDITVKDTDLTMSNVFTPLYATLNINVEGGKQVINCNLDTTLSAFTSVDGNIILNSELEIDYDSEDISLAPSVMFARNIIIKGGNYNISSKKWGILALEGISVEKGNLNIDVEDGAALAVASAKKLNPADVIKFHYVNAKNNYVLGNSFLYEMEEAYIISYYLEEPASRYETINDFNSHVANKLSIVEYNKVKFNGNGGKGTMADIYLIDATVTLPDVEFAAPKGKIFKGWALDANGTNMVTKVDNTKSVTVYAIWENGIKTETKTEYVEVPVEKEITKEVIKEVPKIVEKEVTKEVIKEVPKVVEKVVTKEVVKEVPKIVEKVVTKECPAQEACVENANCGTKTWCFALLVADAIAALGILGYVIFKRK